MIKKLRNKFILLAMVSLFVLMFIVIAGMNLMNYSALIRQADNELNIISNGQGIDSDFYIGPESKHKGPLDSRYFSILMDETGQIVHADISKIGFIGSPDIEQYVKKVVYNDRERGFVDRFRYRNFSDFDGRRIVFLDCGRELDAFKQFLCSSIAMSAAGFCMMFFVISFFAGRILRPVEESYLKQKRFITDVSHEIKTPLTIINTNADLLEMEIGENESIDDIKSQAKRLNVLTNDLVYLAKMEEAEGDLAMIDFPVSDIAADTVHSFKSLIKSQKKEFSFHIERMISIKGNAKDIERLIILLMDNAVKYSPAGGEIEFNLKRCGKYIEMTVINDSCVKMDSGGINNIFDRFYRVDESRNSETGGYGIGLSTARAIVSAHGGKIKAEIKENCKFKIIVNLPI